MKQLSNSVHCFFERHPKAKLGAEALVVLALGAVAVWVWTLLGPYMPSLSFDMARLGPPSL